MIYENKNLGGTVEILAADVFTAIPIAVQGSAVVKAGTPLTASGAVSSTGSDAAGILLYDVDPTVNPNAALVVQGVIDLKKAQAHSGVTLNAEALKAAVPGVVLRDNIGVNADDTGENEGDTGENEGDTGENEDDTGA